MRKTILVLSLIFGILFSANAFADFTATDIQTGIYTPSFGVYAQGYNGPEDFAYGTGYMGYSHDVQATGNEWAYANGFGQADMANLANGAAQMELFGGELSYSYAVVDGAVFADGLAMGHDDFWWSGPDYAYVGLTIDGLAYQQNAAYSDDLNSWIGGGNDTLVTIYGTDTDVDNAIFSPTAFAYDSIWGDVAAGGGTVAWARQDSNDAFVFGATASFGHGDIGGTAPWNQSIQVQSIGSMQGVAQMPAVGFAAFNASYDYSNPIAGAGIAGGLSDVDMINTANHVQVTSNTHSFAGVVTGPGAVPIADGIVNFLD